MKKLNNLEKKNQNYIIKLKLNSKKLKIFNKKLLNFTILDNIRNQQYYKKQVKFNEMHH